MCTHPPTHPPTHTHSTWTLYAREGAVPAIVYKRPRALVSLSRAELLLLPSSPPTAAVLEEAEGASVDSLACTIYVCMYVCMYVCIYISFIYITYIYMYILSLSPSRTRTDADADAHRYYMYTYTYYTRAHTRTHAHHCAVEESEEMSGLFALLHPHLPVV